VEGREIDGFGFAEVGLGLCSCVEHDAIDGWIRLEGTCLC
jgi:hypothetical protein